jgi:hypothetical protein
VGTTVHQKLHFCSLSKLTSIPPPLPHLKLKQQKDMSPSDPHPVQGGSRESLYSPKARAMSCSCLGLEPGWPPSLPARLHCSFSFSAGDRRTGHLGPAPLETGTVSAPSSFPTSPDLLLQTSLTMASCLGEWITSGCWEVRRKDKSDSVCAQGGGREWWQQPSLAAGSRCSILGPHPGSHPAARESESAF